MILDVIMCRYSCMKCARTYVHMYACMHVSMYACMCVRPLYMNASVPVSIHIHAYIHRYKLPPRTMRVISRTCMQTPIHADIHYTYMDTHTQVTFATQDRECGFRLFFMDDSSITLSTQNDGDRQRWLREIVRVIQEEEDR